MALSPTTVGDLPATPFSAATIYNSDQLIAGDAKLVTKGDATITGGLLLPRGTVLGKVNLGALVGAGPVGTGNGTLTAISGGTRLKAGVYTIKFTAATTYTVTNPYGEALANGVNGAYANPEVNFTITAGGTAFVAGDTFTITVAIGAGTYKKSVATAVDGSQDPAAILADDADASGGDVNSGIYLTGEFNQNRIAFDGSWSVATLTEPLRRWNIQLKPAMSSAAPT